MNPYPYHHHHHHHHSFEYIVQMNGTPYPVKMEEPDCYPQSERELAAASPPVLPYMNTFAKHGGGPSMAMLYPQLTYDIPILLNQRRRSAQPLQDPLDLGDEPPGYPPVTTVLKESKYTGKKGRGSQWHSQGKRRQDAATAAVASVDDAAPPHPPQPPPPFQLLSDSALDAAAAAAAGGHDASDAFSAKSRKSFFCRQCGKTFKFQTSLLRHNNKVHISKYQCPTCSRVFSRQAYLDVHTSKQGSSCYLDPTMRISRGRQQMPPLSTPGTD